MNVPPAPKFDLAATNFPPLPGCVVSMQGDTTPEMRLSDVVRGLKVTTKVKHVFCDITYALRTLINCIRLEFNNFRPCSFSRLLAKRLVRPNKQVSQKIL